MSTTKIVVTTPDSKQTVMDLPLSESGFNVLVHDQGMGVDIPEFIEVNPHDTIECMRKMTEGEWRWISKGELFKTLWQEAYDHERSKTTTRQPVITIPETVAALNKMDMGMIHIAGMIILCCEAMFAGKNVFCRNPETYLHPATERYIAGMLQKMLELAGCRGTVTKTDKAPKNTKKSKPRPQDKTPQIDSPEKLKAVVIEWLGCMNPTKQIVQRPDGSRLTASEVIEEVKNNTEIGILVMGKFVELQENPEKWAH